MKRIKNNFLLRLYLIFVALIFVLTGLDVYFSLLHHYKGSDNNYIWSETDEFNIDDIAVIQKQKNKEFKILNLADIQLCDLEDYQNKRIIKDEIDYLVQKSNPDLITLTGDQVWSNENLKSLRYLINVLESYNIPYAPVFGNHDLGNEFNSAVAGEDFSCDIYESAPHCLFSRGANNLGSQGNYVVLIKENDKIYSAMYFLNSGYNYEITTEQINWFKWNADGLKEYNNGEYVNSVCFMHEPIPEYTYAYYDYLYDGTIEASSGVYVYCSTYGSVQNGFFNVAKNCGVKDIVCGHQHANNFTLEYEGVRLTFALKTGETSFYYADNEINLNGGTVLTLNNNETIISNCYVPKDMFHIAGSDNIYETYYED